MVLVQIMFALFLHKKGIKNYLNKQNQHDPVELFSSKKQLNKIPEVKVVVYHDREPLSLRGEVGKQTKIQS